MIGDRWVIVVILISVASVAHASDESATVDSAKALKRISGNWYDADAGVYRPPVLSKPISDDIRRTGWEAAPPKPTATSTTPPWTWGSLGLNGQVFGWIVFSVLGLILIVGLNFIIYKYFGDYMPVLRRSKDSKDSIKIDTARVEDLPFEVPVVSNDPLSQAEALMRAGRYNQAVIYLYGYMLLALDQARKLHLQRGKTNRMYLRELRSEPRLRDIANVTMLAFEDVFFGRYDIDQARFATLWEQREEFHRLIRPAESNGGVSVKRVIEA